MSHPDTVKCLIFPAADKKPKHPIFQLRENADDIIISSHDVGFSMRTYLCRSEYERAGSELTELKLLTNPCHQLVALASTFLTQKLYPTNHQTEGE